MSLVKNEPSDAIDTPWPPARQDAVLHIGDALAVMGQLPAGSIDCIWTDPPYRLSNHGVTCVSGKRVSVDKAAWDESSGVALDHQFNQSWLLACHRLLTPSGTIWVSGTAHVYPSVGMAMQEIGFRILNDVVWRKPAPPPNLGCRCFTHATELLLWATKAPKGSPARHCFNYEDMKAENGGTQMQNVWTFSPPGAAEKRHGKHPTQKPVALITRCLRASTMPGQVVFDPFTGTGATGVAALQLGRRFIGCDTDAYYLRIAALRIAEVAGP